MSARKPKGPPLKATGINDFRPGSDRVVRQGAQAFVVSTDGTYAPVAVHEPPIEVFVANLPEARKRMSVGVMFEAVRSTPFLSPEGRAERLRVLLATGEVTFRFEVTEQGRAAEARERRRISLRAS